PTHPTRTRQSLTRKSEAALSRDTCAFPWDQRLDLTAVKPPQHRNRNAATFIVSETIFSPPFSVYWRTRTLSRDTGETAFPIAPVGCPSAPPLRIRIGSGSPT